jgi:tetratricopeptide (TPR) repeat protein
VRELSWRAAAQPLTLCSCSFEPCAQGCGRVVPVLLAESATEEQLARAVRSVEGFAPACACVATEQALSRVNLVLERDGLQHARALQVDADTGGAGHNNDACLRACLGTAASPLCAAPYALVLAPKQMLVLTPGEALADTSHNGVPASARDAMCAALEAAFANQAEGYLLWTLTFTAMERAAFPALLRADVAWTYDTAGMTWLGGSAPDVFHSRAFSMLIDDSKRYFVDNLERYLANIELLQTRVSADPADSSAVFYLAHTLKDAGLYTRALPMFEQRATMGSDQDEVFLSHLLSGRMHALRGGRDVAEACYLRAAETMPSRRVEAFVELAQMLRRLGEPHRALNYARVAAAAVQRDGKPRGEVLYPNADAYDVMADLEVSLAAYDADDDLAGAMALSRLLSQPNMVRGYWLASFDNAAAFVARMQARVTLTDAEAAALTQLRAAITPAPHVCTHEQVPLYGARIDPSDDSSCGPGSVLGRHFSGVAVVVMPSREQHVARFLASFGCSRYLRFPAVMHLTPVELLRSHFPRLRNGEMRLIQAHACALEYAASVGHDSRPVAIFEDDVALVPPAALPSVQHSISSLASAFREHDAGMVLLGRCPDLPMTTELPADALVQPVHMQTVAVCTHAYAVSPDAAAKLHRAIVGSSFPSQLDVIYERMAQRGVLKTYTNAGVPVFTQHQLSDSLNGPGLKGLDEARPQPSLASLSGSPALSLAILPSTHLHGSAVRDTWPLQVVLENVTGRAVELVGRSELARADVIVVLAAMPAERAQVEADVTAHSGHAVVVCMHCSVAPAVATRVDLMLGAVKPDTDDSAVHFPPWAASALVRRSAASSLDAVAFHPALHHAVDGAEAWHRRPHLAMHLGAAGSNNQLAELVSSVFGRVDSSSDVPNSAEVLPRYQFLLCPDDPAERSTEAGLLSHFTGGVPVLCGDADEADAEIWNMGRVLRYRNTSSNAGLLHAMLLLRNDVRFRTEWFQQPILTAGADAWLSHLLTSLRSRLRDALAAKGLPHPAAKANSPKLSTTVVSGFWNITSKHSPEAYRPWLSNALRLNAGMVFYYEDEAVLQLVSDIRAGLQTVFVKLAIRDFAVAQLYDRAWVEPVHIPTAELGMIWLEKVFMISKAASLNPFGSQWYAWMDAGCASYRERAPGPEPWPSEQALARLPRDRVAYTHVEEWYHHFSGTAFMYHAAMVGPVRQRFKEEVRRCAASRNPLPCGDDQYLWTQLLDREPAAFHKVGDGYGELMPLLAHAPGA